MPSNTISIKEHCDHFMQLVAGLTLRASFFSLFIALNCFILESTALSIGLSEAFPPSLSHGCSKYSNNTRNQLVEKLQFMNQKILKDAAIKLSVSSNSNEKQV